MSKIIVVTDAKYVREKVLDVTFSDGLRGEVDFSGWIERYPFFEPLKDLEYFRNFSVDNWTVVWPNGADIAPETLHALVARSRQPQIS